VEWCQNIEMDCAGRGNGKGKIENENDRSRNGSLSLTALISSRDTRRIPVVDDFK
jgi:hypothetical protein